ncbi:hypothetical protein Tco_0963847 [Tanacetum coccineum]
MFQANHEDAYDSDMDEGPNAAVAFMANLSSTSATNNPVNEVHSNDNQIFDNVNYQLSQDMHQEEHLDSNAETEIDDNTILYHQYLLDTEAQNVPTRRSYCENQAYWLSANEIASQASKSATPATPFVRKSRPPSQVLTSLRNVNAVFPQFEGIIKERYTKQKGPDYVSEWCFDYAKQFVEQQLVPFYDHFKKHIQAANDTFFKEIKEFEQIFDELEAEYEQCVLITRTDLREKNLLIINECLIAECLEKDICSIVLSSDIVVPPSSNCLCEDLRSACDREHTKVLELEAEISKQKQLISESEKRFAFLEQNYVSLQLKFQNYKQCIDTSSASNAIFEINKLRQQLQGKDDTIRNLDAQINIMKVLNVGSTEGSCDQQALETDRIQLKDTITSLRIQLDGLKVENVSLKRRYDELSKANTHSRTAYTEKINALTAEIAKLKTELSGKKSGGSTASEKPKVLASGMYTKSSKYIPPPKRANWVKPTPLPKKKQVTFQEPPRTSNRPTQKPPVQQNKKPNVPVNLSTRTKPATESRKPMPKCHTRNHRILPNKSVNARRAADHNRKLNVVYHNQFVIRSLKSVNTKTPHAKHSVNHTKKVWKATRNHNVNTTKTAWRPTGKIVGSVKPQWKPTGRHFALYDNCPLTRIVEPIVEPLELTPSVSSSSKVTKISRSKGRIVADSIAERLTRPTAYKFKTDCSIIPVWIEDIIKAFKFPTDMRHVSLKISVWLRQSEKKITKVFQRVKLTFKDQDQVITSSSEDHDQGKPLRDNMADETVPAPAPQALISRYFHLAFIASASVPAIYIQQFWNTLAYEITPIDQAHQFVSPPSGDAIMDFVNELGYTEAIHFVSRMAMNNLPIEGQEDKPRVIPDFRLGISIRSQRPKSMKVFGMQIPNELISNNIKNAQYYNAYLEMVAKHGAEGCSQKEKKMEKEDSKYQTTKSKSAIDKVKQTAPAAKPKLAKGQTIYKPSTAKPTKPKPAKPTPLQDRQGHKGHARVRGVAIQEPIAEAIRPLPVVEGKGKAIITEEQAAQSLLALHTPKRRSTAYQFMLKQVLDQIRQTVEVILRVVPEGSESFEGFADDIFILEDLPLSSTGTLSSMKNLEDAYAIGDQFINDKSTDDELGKLNVEAEVVSMVTVLIYQASSSVPPLLTPVIDLSPPKPASSTTQAPIFTATTTTTPTTLPPPPQQQSITESELAERIATLEKKLFDLELNNKNLDNTTRNLGSRVYTLELRDLPYKINEAVCENVKEVVQIALQAPLRDRFRDLFEEDMKEMRHQRMFKTGSYKSLPEHIALYEALEASMEHAKRDEFLTEKDKSRKRLRDDQDPPPPPPDSDLNAPSSSSKQQSGPHAEQPVEDILIQDSDNISDSEDTDSTHLLKTKQRPEWLKPILDDERPATPDPAWVIPTSHIPNTVNNWANALATTYQAPAKNSLLAKTGDMRTFMN